MSENLRLPPIYGQVEEVAFVNASLQKIGSKSGNAVG